MTCRFERPEKHKEKTARDEENNGYRQVTAIGYCRKV